MLSRILIFILFIIATSCGSSKLFKYNYSNKALLRPNRFAPFSGKDKMPPLEIPQKDFSLNNAWWSISSRGGTRLECLQANPLESAGQEEERFGSQEKSTGRIVHLTGSSDLSNPRAPQESSPESPDEIEHSRHKDGGQKAHQGKMARGRFVGVKE